jgi:hypothetical protein
MVGISVMLQVGNVSTVCRCQPFLIHAAGLTRIIQCAVEGLLILAGAKPARQLVAPAGSTWSGLRR